MKKVLFGLLVSALCLGALTAQEEAEDSMFSPSISIENELTLPFVKSGEDDSKGNTMLDKGEIENKTTAKFGVGIAIGENFSLNPYVKDSIKFGGKGFSSNKFMMGLGMEYAASEMLSISAGLAYVNKLANIKIGEEPSGTQSANGFQGELGLSANIEAIFLELEAGYEVEGLFATAKGKDASTKLASWDHTFTIVDAKMDFFNFIKEGLNSGLTLSDELTIGVESATVGDEYGAEREIGNEFVTGLHFAPLDFLDVGFGVNIASKTTAEYDKDKGYKTTGGELTVGLPLAVEFSKGMFTFGLEYTPTLMKNEHKYDKEGKFEKTEKGTDTEQELKVTVSIKL